MKQIKIYDNKNLDILKSLIRQYGNNAKLKDVIEDLQKKTGKEKVVLS